MHSNLHGMFCTLTVRSAAGQKTPGEEHAWLEVVLSAPIPTGLLERCICRVDLRGLESLHMTQQTHFGSVKALLKPGLPCSLCTVTWRGWEIA